MGYFFYDKKAPKTKFAAKFKFSKIWVSYQSYKNLDPPKRWETLEKIEMFFKKESVSSRKKNISALILILDLGYGSRYLNLVLVIHCYTITYFVGYLCSEGLARLLAAIYSVLQIKRPPHPSILFSIIMLRSTSWSFCTCLFTLGM